MVRPLIRDGHRIFEIGIRRAVMISISMVNPVVAEHRAIVNRTGRVEDDGESGRGRTRYCEDSELA